MKNGIFKRTFAAALSAALLFSCAAAAEPGIPHEAELEAEIAVSNPVSNITAGDEAYVRVELALPNSEIYAYELGVEYDSGCLTYSGAEGGLGAGAVSAAAEESGRIKVAFSNTGGGSGSNTVRATLRFKTNRADTANVTLKEAAVVSPDMGYKEYDGLNKSTAITIKSKTNSSVGGGGGGSYGGFSGGGGTFSVGGDSNTVTSVSQPLEFVDPSSSAEPTMIFNDLDGFEWAVPAITDLYARGAVSGYDDGGFHPGSGVTRAEFCKFITAGLGVALPETSETAFEDVAADEWYAPYIAAAAELKIINGYEDGGFRPDNNITREEAAAVICRAADALGAALPETRLNINFKDENEIQDIFVGYVDKLYTVGIINGDDDGYFRPADSLSRAETAQMIDNLIKALEPEPTEMPEIEPIESGGPEIADEEVSPKGAKMVKAADESETADGEKETPDPEMTAEPNETREPEATAEPTGTEAPRATDKPQPTGEPAVTEKPEATEEPSATEKPSSTEAPITTDEPFMPDVVFGCDGTDELYSYSNIYAYNIPDDGSRDAFYDDFTTFQRSAAGGAEAVYKISYAQRVRVVTYFYAGEPLKDFAFESSADCVTWNARKFSADYLAAEGKWTRAVYSLDVPDSEPYIKMIFPETVNWWTPLISEVSAETGEARPEKIIIDGSDELIIPNYDSAEYKFSARLVDQIGETVDEPVKLSVKDGGVSGISISEDGVVVIKSGSVDGTEFTILAEAGGFSAELPVTLKAALAGDLNGDGAVTDEDIKIVLISYDKRSGGADWTNFRDGDINRDGKISVIDIAYISKKAAIENE